MTNDFCQFLYSPWGRTNNGKLMNSNGYHNKEHHQILSTCNKFCNFGKLIVKIYLMINLNKENFSSNKTFHNLCDVYKFCLVNGIFPIVVWNLSQHSRQRFSRADPVWKWENLTTPYKRLNYFDHS